MQPKASPGTTEPTTRIASSDGAANPPDCLPLRHKHQPSCALQPDCRAGASGASGASSTSRAVASAVASRQRNAR